jgi:hypothetical protein
MANHQREGQSATLGRGQCVEFVVRAWGVHVCGGLAHLLRELDAHILRSFLFRPPARVVRPPREELPPEMVTTRIWVTMTMRMVCNNDGGDADANAAAAADDDHDDDDDGMMIKMMMVSSISSPHLRQRQSLVRHSPSPPALLCRPVSNGHDGQVRRVPVLLAERRDLPKRKCSSLCETSHRYLFKWATRPLPPTPPAALPPAAKGSPASLLSCRLTPCLVTVRRALLRSRPSTICRGPGAVRAGAERPRLRHRWAAAGAHTLRLVTMLRICVSEGWRVVLTLQTLR